MSVSVAFLAEQFPAVLAAERKAFVVGQEVVSHVTLLRELLVAYAALKRLVPPLRLAVVRLDLSKLTMLDLILLHGTLLLL